LDTEISPKPRPRLGIDIRERLESSLPVGQPVEQPVKVEDPLKAQAGEGRTAEAGSNPVVRQPVQYPVEVGVPYAAQAEDGSPAEAGNHAGRQAAGAVTEQGGQFINGAS